MDFSICKISAHMLLNLDGAVWIFNWTFHKSW